MARHSKVGALAIAALVNCARYEAGYAPSERMVASPAAPPPAQASSMPGHAGSGAFKGAPANDRGGEGNIDRKEQSGDPRDGTVEPKKRMVHYDGSVRVRVTDPRKTLEDAATMATDMGGFVEQQTENMVMLRVPVEHVRDAFARLLKMGDVLSRSLTAQDVTDAFTASELRLKTLRASRDRLIALLASVKDEQERLQILAEIRRLTEDIDTLDLQVKTLAKLAAFSRLTLETVPRETRGTTKADALAAFRWLDDLSPFRRDVAASERMLKLSVPKEMVALDNSSHWVAESADGAVVWTSKRKNRPEGSSDFWASAIADRLGTDFSEAKRETIGGYDFVRFVDAGETHYRYLIGVRASGSDLETIEIYYPTPAHEARYAPAVEAAIAGGAT